VSKNPRPSGEEHSSQGQNALTETLETTLYIKDFRTEWASVATRRAVLQSAPLLIAGWNLEAVLVENNGTIRFELKGVADNKCPLYLSDVHLSCGKTFSFPTPYVLEPSWTTWEKRPNIGNACGWENFETEERLLARSDENGGTLSFDIRIIAKRPCQRRETAKCLSVSVEDLSAVFADPGLITIRNNTGCEVQVPRALLAAHSPVLAAAWESGMVESKTHMLDIPDVGQQLLEDLRDCLISGGLPASVVTDWQRLADLLVVADKYAITPLVDACTFYVTMASSRDFAAKLLLMADGYSLFALRKAVMFFAVSNSQNFEAVRSSDEYDAFSADLLRDFWAHAAARKTQEAPATAAPLDMQWGNVPHEFPDDTEWEKLPKDALRRACFERLLITSGTAAEQLVRLSTAEPLVLR